MVLEHRPQYNNFTLKAFRQKWLKWVKVQAICTYNYKNTRFYHYDSKQIEEFNQYMEKQIRYATPVLAPAWFLLSFFKFIYRLKIWQNIRLMNIALLQGLYAAWLCIYIWNEKRQKTVHE